MNFIFDFWIWSVLPGIILVPKKNSNSVYCYIIIVRLKLFIKKKKQQ